MLSWLVVLTVALAATDAQGDSLDMASNRRGPDEVCWDEVDSIQIKVHCTLPSGNLLLEVYRPDRTFKIYCSKNSTLVCDELQETKPFFDKYKDTGKWNNSFDTLHIDTCSLSRDSLACLLGVVGANETGLAKLQGVAGNLEPVLHEGLEAVTSLYMYNLGKGLTSLPYNVLSLLPNLKDFTMRDVVVELTSETGYVLSKLTTLKLDRCGIKSVPKGAFKTTPEIKNLLLKNNMIEFIDVDAFEGLTKLHFLNLDENYLTHLPGGIFRHTPNITFLYLNYNKLPDLSDEFFTGLNKLGRIAISYNNAVLKLSNKTFSNLPSVSELYLDYCFIEIIPAELFRNTTNLSTLSLEGNNITYLPNNVFKGLKLFYLNLSRNKISYLNSDVFSEQTSMNELILSGNDLKSLPGGLFSNMNRLKILYLGNNSIEFLNKSTFKGLIRLEELSLSDNQIEHIDQETFDSTMLLVFLSLSNNKLTISKEKNVRKVTKPSGLVSYFSPLENLKKLRTLDLSHNNISVYCEDWSYLGSSDLDLSYNYFTSLPPTVFYKNHTKVNLLFNKIQQVEPPSDIPNSTEATFFVGFNPYRCDCNLLGFIRNEKLRKMFDFFVEETKCAQPPQLKGVKLVNLQPELLICDVDFKTGDIIKQPSNDSNYESTASAPYSTLSHLPNLSSFIMNNASLNLTSATMLYGYVLSELKTLELTERIKSIPKGAFKSTPEIQMLSLWNNKIEFIDVDAFEGLTKLVHLSLNANLLTHLPGGMFRHTPNVARLDLYANKLLDLSDDLFTGLNKLKQILISDNKAVLKLGNKTFSNLPSLDYLQLDWCLIENVPAELFRNTTNLKILSLEGNNIEKLPNNVFKGLKLTYLSLSHNKISYLNSDVFSEQTSMTELILSYNNLKSLPGGLFSNMNSLKILDLGHNSIGFLNKLIFNGLGNLKELSLAENRLEYLDHAIFEFTSSLEVLSLSNNKLTISEEKNVIKMIEPQYFLDDDYRIASSIIAHYYSPLKNLTRLNTLDLSHNNISIICEDWTKMVSLTELDLSYNNITSLSIVDFNFPTNSKIDLRHNNIERFEVPINRTYTTEATFLMDYNPYRCDCYLYHFIHNYKLGTKMPKINVTNAECAQPTALKGAKLVDLQPEVLTCEVDCKTGDIIKHPSSVTNCKCILNPIQLKLEMFCDYLPDVFPKLHKHLKLGMAPMYHHIRRK